MTWYNNDPDVDAAFDEARFDLTFTTTRNWRSEARRFSTFEAAREYAAEYCTDWPAWRVVPLLLSPEPTFVVCLTPAAREPLYSK